MATFSFIFGMLFMLSGSMGIPMGMPPGPEDPMMARLAPEDCLVYSSWSGIADIDGDANPTEKWLSQPKASVMIGKLRKAYRGYLLHQAAQSDDRILNLASKLMVEAVDIASVQPAAFYLDEVEMDGATIKTHGAVVIKLGKREAVVVSLFDELYKEFETLKAPASHHAFEPVEIDGQRAIKVFTGPTGNDIHVVIRDGYFIMGLGEGALAQVAKNMATEPPVWLAQLRGRLKIDRISSVAYIDAEIIEKLDDYNAAGWAWWSSVKWAQGVENVSWVAGVDQNGFLCRAELVGDNLEDNDLLGLIDLDPIPKRFLAEHPADKTFSLATRLSGKKILELLRNSLRGTGQKEMLDESLAKFQKLSGVSLEEDLLSSIGDYVSIYYDFKMDGFSFNNQGWLGAIGIEDEMSFPEHMFQINKAVATWVEDIEGIEFKTRKIGQYEIQYLETMRAQNKFAWAVVGDQWYFAAIPEDIENHMKRFSKVAGDAKAEKGAEAVAGKKRLSYLEHPSVVEILEFGNRSGFGNPVTIGHIDLPDILQVVHPFVAGMTQSDQPFREGFDFKWNDIPPLDELINGVTPNFMAIFKTDKGFQLYQRQTYPGAPPVVTAAAAGIVAFSTQFGNVTTKKRMYEIGQAHLAFEKKHGRLCASHSTGPAGESLLSWRVHLLPFLGHQELYDKFRLSEPWDSAHNKSLAAEMPEIYKHSTMELEPGKTVFLVPTSVDTLFNRVPVNAMSTPLGIGAEDIKDPRAEILMLMEVRSKFAVTWTEPSDFDKLGKDFRMMSARSGSNSRMNVLTSDGSLRSLGYMSVKNYDLFLKCSDGGKVTFPKPYLFD